MIEDSDQASGIEPMRGARRSDDELPFIIELWDLQRAQAERILGRAASLVLARAIYVAALQEHLGRRIRLMQGDKVIAESD